MRSQENKRRLLRHYIDAPKRFLRKARDFYVESMVTIDGKVGPSGCRAPQMSQLPKNFGVSSCRTTKIGDNEGLKELLRSVSERNIGSEVEFERRRSMAGCRRVERSYSIGLGRIGTIEEERSCDFEEEEESELKSDLLFARSRSYATTKRNVGYY